MITRRNFVKTCGIMTLSGVMAPAFLAKTVAASELQPSLAGGKRALVVVQMTGGNDGLNTLVPFTDSTYYNVRPTLAIKADSVLKLNDSLGLNPGLKELKGLYDNGQMAVVAGVGYPNPSYSHFRSMEIWQSANPASAPKDGWLGRYLQSQAGSGEDLSRVGMTVGSAAQGGRPPVAFWTDKTIVLTFAGLNNFQFGADPAMKGDREAQLAVARQIYNVAGRNNVADYVRTTALDALSASDSLASLGTNYTPGTTYPKSGFGDRLKQIAQILSSDFGTRVFFVATDGSFDTHHQQAQYHDKLLGDMSVGLAAFYQDLQAHGLADSVLTMTFSEFGRRVAENGSAGTDHGSAEPMFIIGGKNAIKPGVYGQQPALTNLDSGNMRPTTDFRSVYGTIVQKWLGTDPTPVVGGTFPALGFLG